MFCFPNQNTLLRDPSGSVMPIIAICLAAILGIVGVAIGLGIDIQATKRLQNTSDSAALAGATAYINADTNKASERKDAAVLAASNFSTSNAHTKNAHTKLAKIEVSSETKDAYGQHARIKVDLGREYENNIAKWAQGSENKVASRYAIAEATIGLPLCLLALDPAAPVGIELRGGGILAADECVVWSNATSDTSMTFRGSGSATGEAFCAAGLVDVDLGYDVAPAPQESCNVVPDPLASWTPPTFGLCSGRRGTTITDAGGAVVTEMDPDVYCNGLDINADRVLMNPGLYVVKDGPLRINGNIDVIGEGVTILMSGPGATIEIRGQASLAITAPESGDYAGLAIVEDRTTTPGDMSVINGSGEMDIEGVIYLPNQHIRITGNGMGRKVSPYLQIVAKTMEIGGSGELAIDFDESATSLEVVIPATRSARLVE